MVDYIICAIRHQGFDVIRRPETRQRARALRKDGMSIKKIAREVGAAASTVSLWTRDIVLTENQQKTLKERPPGFQPAGARAVRRAAEWRKVAAHREAVAEWADLKGDPAFLFGLALYVGEGRKGQDGSIALANTDPRVLRAAKGFFCRIGLCESSMRVRVQVPEGGHDQNTVTAHWLRELGLDPGCFSEVRTVYRRKNGNKYPFGTCTIRISDIFVKRKLLTWMDLALSDHG